jgi:hypothetical protein
MKLLESCHCEEPQATKQFPTIMAGWREATVRAEYGEELVTDR